MEQDTLQNLLKIYKNLYTYKHLLKDSPAITIDVETLAPDEISSFLPTIQQETQAVIAYLLGLKELPDTSSILARINQYYKEDNFWRKLLLSYVDVCQALENEPTETQQTIKTQEEIAALQAIEAQQSEIALDVKNLSDNVNSYIQRRKDIIARFSKALDTQNFPIDSKRLFTNYLNMAEKDPENAWKLLITSPAAFSPLKSVDAFTGKILIPTTQALKINKSIGHFIKSLKA